MRSRRPRRARFASVPGEIPDAEPAPVPRGYACLVVDDNAVCRALTTTLLDGLGHRATQAGSAEEALRLLETQAFDIAFVDLRMAPTDGLETARRIRGLGERGR